MAQTIDTMSRSALGGEAECSPADLAAFKTACWAYLREQGWTTSDEDQERAVDFIFGDGDFWPRVLTYAPDEAERADFTIV